MQAHQGGIVAMHAAAGTGRALPATHSKDRWRAARSQTGGPVPPPPRACSMRRPGRPSAASRRPSAARSRQSERSGSAGIAPPAGGGWGAPWGSAGGFCGSRAGTPGACSCRGRRGCQCVCLSCPPIHSAVPRTCRPACRPSSPCSDSARPSSRRPSAASRASAAASSASAALSIEARRACRAGVRSRSGETQSRESKAA